MIDLGNGNKLARRYYPSLEVKLTLQNLRSDRDVNPVKDILSLGSDLNVGDSLIISYKRTSIVIFLPFIELGSFALVD